jgi:hypothetical protein
MLKVLMVGVGISSFLGVFNYAHSSEMSVGAERAFEWAISRAALRASDTDQSTDTEAGETDEPAPLRATAVSDATIPPRS